MATLNSSGSSGSGGPPPSQQKLGHYRIVRQIARSNDVVYEAIDPALNRKIALKELLLPPHLAGQQRRERIERFQREAKAIGALKHPNIVTIYEIGQEGDRHFIAMEFLEGPTVRDVLNLRGPLPMTEALQIGIQFSEALGYAHSMGIIHRDVKPDNAHLIPPGNVVKLTDFGIARMETEPTLTSAGQIFGTPSYMSPEQIAARGLDYRSDIFSLGVVLYEIIVGRKPFLGDSVVTITYHIMNTAPSIPTNIPNGVSAVLSRALAKDRDQRYQNMAALAADLRSELLFHESPYHNVGTGGSFADVSGPRANRPNASVRATPMGIGGGDLAPFGTAGSPLPTPPASASSSALAGAPATSGVAQRGPTPAPQSSRPARAPSRSLATFALSLAGIVVVLALTVWGGIGLYHTVRQESRLNAAMRAYQEGIAAQNRGDIGAAMSDYSRAALIAPRNSDVSARASSANAMLANSAGSTAQPGQALPSVPAAPGAAETAPSDNESASDHYNQGLSYDRQGDMEDAAAQYAAAARADPMGQVGSQARQSAASDYMQLGNQAASSGNMAAARQDWQQVVAVAPGSALGQQANELIQQAAGSEQSSTGSSSDGEPTESSGPTGSSTAGPSQDNTSNGPAPISPSGGTAGG